MHHKANRALFSHLRPRHSCVSVRRPPPLGSHPELRETERIGEFASIADGEWEGVQASFTRGGKPIELPERFVPSAFRDWGVVLTDWQVQASCEVSSDFKYSIRQRRMMPTVGCEADAVAFIEEAVPIEIHRFINNGSFIGASGSLPGSSAFDVHFCFAADQQQRSRVRVTTTLNPSSPPPHLQNVSITSESWVGVKGCNEELLGCGGGASPFAQGPVSEVMDTLLPPPHTASLSINLPLDLTIQVSSRSTDNSTEANGSLEELVIHMSKGGRRALVSINDGGITSSDLD